MSTRPPRRRTVCQRLVVVAVGLVALAACHRVGVQPGRSPGPTQTSQVSEIPLPTLPEPPAAVPRPAILWKPIPFSDAREQETRAYAQEHYGLDSYELMDPHVIVEHFTASSTFDPVFQTFAVDAPHLGELPGTCAHFVIDTDGTIYQLVALNLICRHTVGLNYTAIGIEMVGMSDDDVLDNPQQLAATLQLTVWLMQRFGIELRNVIGHNESLTSPFHQERVPSLRCQTHQDWNHEDMEIFRAKLRTLSQTYHLELGPRATLVDNGC
jgi:beta-N-acetylhexosaminidase